MSKFVSVIAGIIIAAVVASVPVSVSAAPTLPPLTTMAAGCKQPTFFSLPTWYRYLGVEQKRVKVDGKSTTVCQPKFSLMKNGKFDGTGLMLLLLGIVDILLRLAGILAVLFVIYGGFRYMTSQGSPDGAKAAQSTILNALIGLVVAVLAASIVSFIGFSIG